MKNKELPEVNTVNHPSHYNQGKYEVIDVIYDWGLDFDLGNAIKYIGRAGKKDPTKISEDLKKSIWYLQHKIKLLEEEITIIETTE